MKSIVSMNTQKVSAALLRVAAFVLFIPHVLNIGSLGLFALTYLFKPFDQSAFRAEFVPQLWYLGANTAVFIGVFFGANRLSRWIFPDEDAVIFEGDPYAWALPAIQITGLVFAVGAIAGVFPLIQTYSQHVDGGGIIPSAGWNGDLFFCSDLASVLEFGNTDKRRLIYCVWNA